MTLSLIVAMSKNGVIGKDNKLPWHLPEDLKRFKRITMGHPIIMGRKTFESIGKPLPGRKNIVLSRSLPLLTSLLTSPYKGEEDQIVVMNSLEKAFSLCNPNEEVFVIGGAEIFKLALPFAHKIYLTLIEQEIDGDIFFQKINLQEDFEIVEQSEAFMNKSTQLSYRFITLTRRKNFPSFSS